MKRLYILLVFITTSLAGFAYDALVDGIAYNLNQTAKTAEVTEAVDDPVNVVIPESITVGGVEYSITSIGEYSFYYRVNLISVTIGNSVESIGEWAFRYCSSLSSVIIGNSVESIGECAFSDCSSLISVIIGNSVESIGEEAFSGCSSLSSVMIGNSVESIGGGLSPVAQV